MLVILVWYRWYMENEQNHLIADIPEKAIIEHNGKILIVCNDEGKWQLPGGRLHIGEQPVEGLKREIKEELGIDIEPLRIFDAFVFTSASGKHHYTTVWLCKPIKNNTAISKRDEKEVHDFKWISSAEELEELQSASTQMWQEYKEVLKKFFGEII